MKKTATMWEYKVGNWQLYVYVKKSNGPRQNRSVGMNRDLRLTLVWANEIS